jgi:hypothetical protein
MESDCGLFYTYYERSDVKDRASRPLVISFNGGASIYLLNIDDDIHYNLMESKKIPILF